uniref:FHA domain-containing protein n=1 Tax=Kalmanozyma brasiliensis (strain GHG001) TaxID=1365824 RepID=V5E7U2_KALBG
MWLLQGRFAENSRQELSKLLKYGQTYTLGRKIPADIVIDSKFVSRVSCHITIASEDTIASHAAGLSDPAAFHKDLSVRPRVTIRFEANKSRKTFGVTQQPNSARRSSGSEPVEVQVPADHEHEIQDGDSFALTTTISLRLVWKPLAVCFAAKIKESAIAPLRKPALQLGIYLSPPKSKWRDGYTHLCVAQVKPTESVHCALLHAAAIVSIEYFQELFCRAELPRHDPVSLETSFEELDLLTYQPTFDQQELSELPDLHKLLLPQERRTYMLKGTTCVLFALPTEESEMSIYKSILATAGAHVFIHNPQAESLQTKADFAKLLMPYKSSALSYWRNSGSKARSEAPDEGLVPDSEPQFLQALNTQRAKGKRMDDFDVEFNRLQIAKPGTQSQLSSLGGTLRSRPGRGAQQQQDASNAPIDEDYEAFKQMAEEELRIHVRGNFVQVDFVPLVRTKKVVDARSQTPQGTDGVPNFKKFRPKAVGSAAPANASQRPRISMVLPESNDYGLGQSYWEDPDGQSGPAAEASIGSRRASEAVQTSRGKGKSRSRVALDPASVEETAVDLGLDGRDSMDSEDEADMTTMLERRHGSKSRTAGASGSAARVRKRPAAVVQDSDDDMATPSNAAAGRKKRATARTATMLVDSDDDHGSEDGGGNDDDGNFAGFGRSTSTRRRRDPPASGTSRARRSVF